MDKKTTRELAILTVLEDGPASGHTIVVRVRQRDPHLIASVGPLYPQLHHLVRSGHATIDPAGTRIEYRLTQDGLTRRQALQDQLATDTRRASWLLPSISSRTV